jgi:hypothetical protein
VKLSRRLDGYDIEDLYSSFIASARENRSDPADRLQRVLGGLEAG